MTLLVVERASQSSTRPVDPGRRTAEQNQPIPPGPAHPENAIEA